MTDAGQRPLDGVLVVDLTRHLPGPYASSVAFRRGGEPFVPAMLTGGLACYDLYRCADALWLSVGALERGVDA